MRLELKYVALALPLLMGACAHKKKQAQNQPLAPPLQDIPATKPETAPANLPPSVATIPQKQPQPAPAPPPRPAATTTAKKTPPRPAHHRKPPAGKPAEAPAPPPANSTEQASNGTPEVSAIGQLSSGEPADVRRQASASIADTEQKLNKIHRSLSEQEQKTANQIREFLKQAKAALNSGDTDGAYTLALKAKVLLGELTE